MVEALVPVTVIEVGDNTALPAVAQVDEKLTVTGEADEAPLTLTVTTEAPYDEMVAGEAVAEVRLTLVAETVKTFMAVSAAVSPEGVKLAVTTSAPTWPATGFKVVVA